MQLQMQMQRRPQRRRAAMPCHSTTLIMVMIGTTGMTQSPTRQGSITSQSTVCLPTACKSIPNRPPGTSTVHLHRRRRHPRPPLRMDPKPAATTALRRTAQVRKTRYRPIPFQCSPRHRRLFLKRRYRRIRRRRFIPSSPMALLSPTSTDSSAVGRRVRRIPQLPIPPDPWAPAMVVVVLPPEEEEEAPKMDTPTAIRTDTPPTGTPMPTNSKTNLPTSRQIEPTPRSTYILAMVIAMAMDHRPVLSCCPLGLASTILVSVVVAIVVAATFAAAMTMTATTTITTRTILIVSTQRQPGYRIAPNAFLR